MTTATLLDEREPAGSATLDAVVVGAGPAGLSAALVLGRARRRVLDTGRPANRVSNAVGGLLGQVGVAPAELRRSARKQLREYPKWRSATTR